MVPYTGTIALGWGQISDGEYCIIFFEKYLYKIIFNLEDAGLVDELRWVALTVLSNEECQTIYGHHILDNMVCVEGNYNEGACKVIFALCSALQVFIYIVYREIVVVL